MTTEATDGVDQGLYDSGESEPAPKASPDSVDDQATKQATDLLSKSSFPGGCKVGDKYEVEITGDHGEQFSVKVLGSEEDDTDETPPADSGSDSELDQMNSDY